MDRLLVSAPYVKRACVENANPWCEDYISVLAERNFPLRHRFFVRREADLVAVDAMPAFGPRVSFEKMLESKACFVAKATRGISLHGKCDMCRASLEESKHDFPGSSEICDQLIAEWMSEQRACPISSPYIWDSGLGLIVTT